MGGSMSELDDGGDTQMIGFDCSCCGETTLVEIESEPEAIEGNIYECTGCGENILMDNYVGDREVAL